MVIVTGHLMVDPRERERYLAGCLPVVALARAAQGCHDFAISADLVDPGRINILEHLAFTVGGGGVSRRRPQRRAGRGHRIGVGGGI
jgi:hypothetical protein